MLKIQNLSIGFLSSNKKPLPIVRDVSFFIPQGEVMGVVGESGSGKSLTAQAIGRMLPANLDILNGQVELDGLKLTALSEKEMHSVRGRKMSYVFQDPLNALNPTR